MSQVKHVFPIKALLQQVKLGCFFSAEKLRNVGYTNAYKTFLNKMNMQIAQYGHAVVRLQGARKIKIVPKLKNQTSKLLVLTDC